MMEGVLRVNSQRREIGNDGCTVLMCFAFTLSNESGKEKEAVFDWVSPT